MSYLLRSTLKYSLSQFNITSIKNKFLFQRIVPCVSHVLNYSHADALQKPSTLEHSNNEMKMSESIDKSIQKLDMAARRLGRISIKNVEEVLSEIKRSHFASVTQSLMIIRCCGNLLIEEPLEKRTKLVQEIWKTFEDLGVNLDIGHYNALLRVYLENEYDFAPSDILVDLEKKGLEPNRVTYSRLIMKYCQKGDIDGATSILEYMRKKDIPINVNIFNALIFGHTQRNDMESAEGILHVMNQAKIEPTSETYAFLICGYIKEKNLDKVNSILNDCESHEILFNDSENFNIVYAFAVNGFEAEIDEFLSRLKRGPGYNQEAINIIYKLISSGYYESAFKVLKTMVRSTRVDGSYLSLGNFFISHLIRCNVSSDLIIKYCDKLIKSNLNSQAVSVAMENSLRFDKESLALTLFKFAQENDIQIRQHFFWPLLLSNGKKQNINGLLDILSTMNTEYKFIPNSETLREYVMPYVLKKNKNIDSVILDLKACGCSVASIVSSSVIYYLNQKEIMKAAKIAEMYSAYYSPYLIRRPLIASYLHTKNLPSLIILLKEISNGIVWRTNNAEIQKEDENINHRNFNGQVVYDLAKSLKKQMINITEFQNILQEMFENGIGINLVNAKEIQNVLQNELTSEISTILDKLTSDKFSELSTVPKNSKLSIGSLDDKTLERLYESMKKKGEPVKYIEKQLFLIYGRQKNLEKLLELKQKLEAENFIFTSGMYAFVIDTYVEHNKLDEALKLYDYCVQTIPNFSLNSIMLLRLVLLLVQNDQIEKAVQILEKKSDFNNEYKDLEEGSFLTSSLCWKILNTFAEKEDAEKVKQFFDLFISHELVEVNNILLGSLIKVHLKRGDTDSAIEEFEKCCKKYRCTPWKHELTKILIEKEDPVKLQKLTDLSTQIHGEINSLYDLMLSFLECGRIKQAKKILDTPGMQLRQSRLQNACIKYQNEGAVEHLKNLVEITKDVGNIDRSELFFSLLTAYEKADNVTDALGLWIQMQEEDIQPTSSFLICLAELLKRHEITVPFSIPEKESEKVPSKHSESKMRVSSHSQTLRKYLQNGYIDKALHFKDQLKQEQLNKTDWSLLMENCLKQNRYKEAVQIYDEYFSKRQELPHNAILKYFLKKAMLAGDIDLINRFSNISETLQTYLGYNSIRCRTYLNANKTEEFLTELEQKLENMNSENSQSFLKSLPKGGLITIMKIKPEFIPKITKMLEKLKEKDGNSNIVQNLMWVYYMTEKKFDKAREIFSDSLSKSNSLSYRKIIRDIRQNIDAELGMVLIEMLENFPKISPAALSMAYTATIHVLVQQNLVEESIKLLERALTKISIDNINRSTLLTVKAACEAKNIDFHYSIPDEQPRRKRKIITDGNESDSD